MTVPTYRLFADNLALGGTRNVSYSVRCEQCGCFLGFAGWADGGAVIPHLTLDQVVAQLQKQSPPLTDTIASVKKHDGEVQPGTAKQAP